MEHGGGESTVAAEGGSSAPTLVATRTFEQRYAVGELLGRGGMGEVRAVHDDAIGRDVAIKRAHDEEHGARLVDEARLQGRLEHPAIVPVYDLGEDPAGTPYFTMRRLHGATLAEVLSQITEPKSPEALRWGRARLLGVMIDVAEAVAYAHRHGVVHRDLKPANVMLGELGELYVLDWGIAKDVTAAPTSVPTASGTPGYMAPEQIDGADVDARADVYALGAILFEVIARAPLVPKTTPVMAAATTLEGVDPEARARELGVDVPPELLEVCIRATALDREARYRSVEELIEGLRRFLEGDRDLERRRALSAEHVEHARRLLDGGRGPSDHALAMRELGHALALDHHNTAAMAMIAAILRSQPDELPPALQARRDESDERFSRRLARSAVAGFSVWLALTIGVTLEGTRPLGPPVALMLLLVLQIGLCAAYVRGRFRPMPIVLLCCVINAVLVGITAHMFSPIVLGPMLAAGTTTLFVLHPLPRLIAPALGLGFASFIVPWVLERTGVLWPSHLPALPLVVEIEIVVIGSAAVAVVALTAASLRRRVASQQWRSELQAWYLAELAPGSAEAVATAADRYHSTGRIRTVARRP